MKAIIFDLDQTLVDSQNIEGLRRTRQWSLVYKSIPSILSYNGIDEILSLTRENDIKLAIVSSGPSSYVQRVLNHFDWRFDAVVCYHDTIKHKPNPEPFMEAISRLNLPARECWAIGDDPKDIIAAKASGTYSGAALWGALDRDALLKEKPDQIFETTTALYEMIYNMP